MMQPKFGTLLGQIALMSAICLTSPFAEARQGHAAENKETVRRAMAVLWSPGDPNQIDKYVAANFVEHQTAPGVPPTREGLKQLVASFRTAFPDLRVTIEDMISEGDKVVVRSTLRGTHKGELRLGPGPATPPTGKAVSMIMIDIIRLQNGKAVEHWGSEDDLGMMQQLGLLSPAAPGA